MKTSKKSCTQLLMALLLFQTFTNITFFSTEVSTKNRISSITQKSHTFPQMYNAFEGMMPKIF